MSYYQAKRKAIAKQYLDEARAAEQLAEKASLDEARLDRSRDWLEKYLSTPQQPKDTSNAEEISEEAQPQRDHEGGLGEAAQGRS